MFYLALYLNICIGGPISNATTVPPSEATARFSVLSPRYHFIEFIIFDVIFTIIGPNINKVTALIELNNYN